MKVLVINCGSSSLKYQLFDMSNESVLAKGLVERIKLEGSVLNHQPEGKEKVKLQVNIPDHKIAIEMVLKALVDEEHGVLKDMGEISAVGHRVVHAGEKFSGSVLITKEVVDALKECIDLAPLHNPPNILGIEATQGIMPSIPMVGVFDTAFHQTMPEKAYLYGIPYDMYKKYGIRRYGFHGTSHKYVSQRAAVMLGKPIGELKLITCHLGNGASIAAVKGGKSVDTSMGFTPLEGLVMGTRCGDIDPAIVFFLMEKENLSINEINNFLNKNCGVYGISDVSSDFRDLEDAAEKGNVKAQFALDIFAYKVQKYIGSYAAAMNGVDAIIFTAGLGENSAYMREKVCADLGYLGLTIDKEKNNVRGKETDVTTPDSMVKVLLVPTNEELMIARDTKDIIQKL